MWWLSTVVTLTHLYCFGSLMKAETVLQIPFYIGPFSVDDAEPDSVTDTAALRNEVVAKDPFLPGADAENGVAGLHVQHVGFKFDAEAVQVFEGVTQQEVLGFGVDGSALVVGRDPGGSDFEPPILRVDVHEAGASDDAV
jgi:hypothetical protein